MLGIYRKWRGIRNVSKGCRVVEWREMEEN